MYYYIIDCIHSRLKSNRLSSFFGGSLGDDCERSSTPWQTMRLSPLFPERNLFKIYELIQPPSCKADVTTTISNNHAIKSNHVYIVLNIKMFFRQILKKSSLFSSMIFNFIFLSLSQVLIHMKLQKSIFILIVLKILILSMFI